MSGHRATREPSSLTRVQIPGCPIHRSLTAMGGNVKLQYRVTSPTIPQRVA
ncbi:hypothetical protein RBB78_20330 [Tunturiibacter empetritectus]|uniref:hypothetical protein n=1 Tax=Tunturiibacter empetritectus TaxID=3069691 RepID=UPI003D9AD80D